MASHSAFFYGTLMARAVLHRVIHGSPTPEPWQAALLTIRPALLPNHCRHRVWGCDYPAIVPEPGGSVRGTFVTGLTEGDMWRLDIFEGDEYERRKVVVKVLGEESGDNVADGEESEEEVETYIWVAGRDRLDAAEWDFEEFTREKLAAWVQEGGEGRESFTDVDEAVSGLKQDPTGGRGVNGKITNQLESTTREALGSAI